MNLQHINGLNFDGLSMNKQTKLLQLFISIVLLLVTNFIPNAKAAPAPQSVPAPEFTEQPIIIDGKFDESAWQKAININDFTVVKPDTGAKPAHQTDTKILYSPDGIYFAISNYQPHDTQVERLTSRDIKAERDRVRIVLDTSNKGLYGYVFTVALGGSLVDGTVLPEKNFSYEWNAPWQAQTSRHQDKWLAEVFIPWNALKLPSAVDKRTIGLSIERHISYLSEDWAMPAIGANRSVFLSALMPVEFDVLESKSELTFVPYFSSSLDRLNKSNEQKYGFDLYYQPTSDSQLSLTVSPDFGQVENDDIVVNFSAFETFAPEKRAFFLEGQEVFNSKGIMMVNTRRIGARPDYPTLEDDQSIESRPGYSDVIAAGKYTGQIGNVRYGILSAAEEDSDYTLDDGTKGTMAGRRFLATRAIYETINESNDYQALGYLGTLVDHFDGNASAHMLDGEYRTGNEKWKFDGQFYMSDNGEEQGYGQWLRGIYSPEAGLEYGMMLRYADTKLDLNDMGYLERNDESRIHFFRRSPEVSDSKDYKSFKMGQWADYRFNKAGETLNARVGSWFNWQLNDLTRFRFTFHHNFNQWDDRNSRDNGSFRRTGFSHLWSRWQSDTTQNFSYGINGWIRNAQISGIKNGIGPFINYSPTQNINIDTSLNFNSDDNWTLWQEDNLFNTFKKEQVNLTVKTTWIIDDAQEVRLAMQWLGLTAESKLAYRINEFGDLVETGETPAQHFTRADLALQLRYKYQFAPLSDLYLVYSRGGDSFEEHPQNMQGFNDMLSNSFSSKNADQLTMKVRYRF